MKTYGVNEIEHWSFDEPTIPKEWQDHLGDLPVPFTMYVEGDGGHGKTEYIMMLSKMIATNIGKIRLNNVEQGKHKSIQQSWKRNEFKGNVPAGKWLYTSITNWEDFKDELSKRNSGKVIVIDSISFWQITAKQIQELLGLFPRKSFIFVAYLYDTHKNKPIKHLCDIKVVVKDFKAYVRGRFEGNKPFTISNEMHQTMMLSKSKKAQTKGLFD